MMGKFINVSSGGVDKIEDVRAESAAYVVKAEFL